MRGNSLCQTAVLHVHHQDMSVGTTFSQQVFSLPLLYQNLRIMLQWKGHSHLWLNSGSGCCYSPVFHCYEQSISYWIGNFLGAEQFIILSIWKWPNHFWDCEIIENVIIFSCPKPSRTQINNNSSYLTKHSTLLSSRTLPVEQQDSCCCLRVSPSFPVPVGLSECTSLPKFIFKKPLLLLDAVAGALRNVWRHHSMLPMVSVSRAISKVTGG